VRVDAGFFASAEDMPTLAVKPSPFFDSSTARSILAQSISPSSTRVARTILLTLASRQVVGGILRLVMWRFFPSKQAPSDSISAVSKRGPHVPGPPSKVVEQQARCPVPSEPLPADSVCREAFKGAVPKRYHANRHPGDSEQQSWKRQGAGRNEQGKRQTDLKCRTRFHFLFSPPQAN
jgi:hypothetical protein